MTFEFLLANEIALLLVPLAFFLLIAVIGASSGKNLPMSKVGLTIKAAVLGILLTILARFVPVPDAIAPYFRGTSAAGRGSGSRRRTSPGRS